MNTTRYDKGDDGNRRKENSCGMQGNRLSVKPSTFEIIPALTAERMCSVFMKEARSAINETAG